MGHRDGNLESALLLALIVVVAAVCCVISAVRRVSVIHATAAAVLVHLKVKKEVVYGS